MDAGEVPDLPLSDCVIKFNIAVPPLSASSLDQHGVYTSIAANGYIYDFMQICNEHIYLYQVQICFTSSAECTVPRPQYGEGRQDDVCYAYSASHIGQHDKIGV